MMALNPKEMRVSATLSFNYSLKLLQNVHSFSSAQKTPVNTGGEFKLLTGFASFDVQATKQEIVEIFSHNQLTARFVHHASPTDAVTIGSATIDLGELLQSPLKKTPQGLQVRVCD